jgi:hypothetical protein
VFVSLLYMANKKQKQNETGSRAMTAYNAASMREIFCDWEGECEGGLVHSSILAGDPMAR